MAQDDTLDPGLSAEQAGFRRDDKEDSFNPKKFCYHTDPFGVPKGLFIRSEPVVEPPQNTSSKKKPKAPNEGKSPWAYASEGTQLAVTLAAMAYLGYLVDARKGTSPWGLIIGAVLGIGVGLYNFLRRFL